MRICYTAKENQYSYPLFCLRLLVLSFPISAIIWKLSELSGAIPLKQSLYAPSLLSPSTSSVDTSVHTLFSIPETLGQSPRGRRKETNCGSERWTAAHALPANPFLLTCALHLDDLVIVPSSVWIMLCCLSFFLLHAICPDNLQSENQWRNKTTTLVTVPLFIIYTYFSQEIFYTSSACTDSSHTLGFIVLVYIIQIT